MDLINLEYINRNRDEFRRSFPNATPYPHIAIDNLVLPDRLHELEADFPNEDSGCWKDVDHEHQKYKLSCSEVDRMPSTLRQLILELNSGPFINWLEDISGIPHLLPDPLLVGGGLHATKPGGYLTPHIDFHTIGERPLFRRLNLLLYLNKDWPEENNGNLEIWDKPSDSIVREIKPLLGNVVLFRTDMDSMHGFSKPVKNRLRKSVALYYYTATESETFSGDSATHWRVQSRRPAGGQDWLRLRMQGAFLFLGRCGNAMAWRSYRMADRFRR